MPVRPLPPTPDLNHLKHQAKDLIRHHAQRLPAAAQVIREFHPRFTHATDGQIFSSSFKLSDAQLVIARQSGFPSWPRLKSRVENPTSADRIDLPHHERITDPEFRRAVDLIDAGDAGALRAHLRRHPDLIHRHVAFEGANYFRNPSLLEFIAENPIRRGLLPANIVEIAGILLRAGPAQPAVNETLSLVASGRVARESGSQVPLLQLLCGHGADPNHATRAAAVHGEWSALRALLDRGAHLDLPLAAALGDLVNFRRLLAASSPNDRHLALAYATQFGHVAIARLLLDAGEDPNRYNPAGAHAHSTPLHQAALSGNLELVKLLVERGARLDWKDTLWHATPQQWAEHEGRTEVAACLGALRAMPRGL